jgi:hypothetical protein
MHFGGRGAVILLSGIPSLIAIGGGAYWLVHLHHQ